MEDSVNMDVMMDNMTNVVGTLLLILIMVQLNVNNTVGVIEDSIAQVTPKQVDDLKKEVAGTEKQVESMQADWNKRASDKDKIAAELKAKTDDLKRHETTLHQRGVKLLDVTQLEKDLAQNRKIAEEKKKEMSALLAERDNLKALLDQTPVPAPPPPKVVNVPAGRPIPPGVTQIRVLVVNQRLYFLTEGAFREQAVREFERNKSTLFKTITPSPSGKVTVTYDHQKTAALLNARKLGDANFEVKFPVDGAADRVRMEVQPKPEGGESAEQIDAPNSFFRSAVAKLRTQPKVIVWFLVYRDSIEAYLTARDMCNRFGVPAGWEFYGAPYYVEYLGAFQVNILRPPSPAPPPSDAAKSSPVAIPAPKRTLD